MRLSVFEPPRFTRANLQDTIRCKLRQKQDISVKLWQKINLIGSEVGKQFQLLRVNRVARVSASVSDLEDKLTQRSETGKVTGGGNDGFDPFRGKPGSVSFYGITHQMVEEGRLESASFKHGTGSFLWLSALLLLILSLVLPPLLVGNVVNVLIKDVILAETLSSLSTEAAFYAGLAAFLAITDSVQRPYLQYSAKRWSLITGLKGYFFTMGLKVIAPLFVVYVTWPELGLEGLVAVEWFDYTLLAVLQLSGLLHDYY